MAMRTVKMVAVGDGAVGKTCMYIRYTTNEFPTDYVPTVFDNYSANITRNGETVSVGFWDTAGEEDYDRLRPLSYPETDIFLIVYSIYNIASLKNVESKWVPELEKHNPGTPYILVGNKIDLRQNTSSTGTVDTAKLLSTKEGKEMSLKMKCASHMECSALTGEGIKELFEFAMDYTKKASSSRSSSGSSRCILL